MSYQLEREMCDRVNGYRRQAELRRSLPKRSVRAALAQTLRKLADRVDPRQAPAPDRQGPLVPLQGRNS